MRLWMIMLPLALEDVPFDNFRPLQDEGPFDDQGPHLLQHPFMLLQISVGGIAATPPILWMCRMICAQGVLMKAANADQHSVIIAQLKLPAALPRTARSRMMSVIPNLISRTMNYRSITKSWRSMSQKRNKVVRHRSSMVLCQILQRRQSLMHLSRICQSACPLL